MRGIAGAANCDGKSGARAQADQFRLPTEDADVGLRVQHFSEKAGESVAIRTDQLQFGEHQRAKALGNGSIRQGRGARFEFVRETEIEREDQLFVIWKELLCDGERYFGSSCGGDREIWRWTAIAQERDGTLQDTLAAASNLRVHERPRYRN